MNYANMIEERKLKQGFIIATLISTIVGTFTTGIGLFDRINDKRKQHKRDYNQDGKIAELERRVNEAEKRSQSRGGGRGPGRGEDEDGVRDSLAYGGPMVRREYDRGYGALGRRFAEGDLLAQTQLQSQIITLQQTVIGLLQQALETGLPPDLNRLRNASEFAREGSIRALRDQYQRMLTAAPLRPGRPSGLVRRVSSTPDMRSDAGSGMGGGGKEMVVRGRGGGEVVRFNRPGPLFCPFAEDLQRGDRPLPRGECPACRTVVPLPERPFVVAKEVLKDRVSRPAEDGMMEVVEYVEDRRYIVSSRFLWKCHREATGFACWLCWRFRDGDTLCKGVEGLVRHLGERHSVQELEEEEDLRVVR